jgi:hypothetical protein
MNSGSVYNGEPALGVLVFVGATVSFGPGVAAFYFFISGLIVWILGIEKGITNSMREDFRLETRYTPVGNLPSGTYE